MRHLELAAAAGLPVVIHTREAAADTLRLLDAHGAGVTVVLHCFSLPDRLPELVERGYYLSFAGNVTFKNAACPAGRRARGPGRPPAPGDRRPLPRAGAVPRAAQFFCTGGPHL